MTKIVLFCSTGGFYYNEEFVRIPLPWKHHYFVASMESTDKPNSREDNVASVHTIVCDKPLSFLNAQGGVSKSKRKPSTDGKYRYKMWVRKQTVKEYWYLVKQVFRKVYSPKILLFSKVMIDGEPMYVDMNPSAKSYTTAEKLHP